MPSDKPTLNPRTAAGRKTLREVHEQWRDKRGGCPFCIKCMDPYPCDASLLLDEIDRLREALEDVRHVYGYAQDVRRIADAALREEE